jgi:hypothetical protein
VPIRQLTWAGTDGWRAEQAHVQTDGDRLTASGVQLGVVPVPYRLDYRLGTTGEWVTRSLDVDVVGAGWRRSVHLARNEGGRWTYRAQAEGEVDLPATGCDAGPLDGALDCDLGLSPLTNTMPILRHGLHREPGAADLTLAWVSVPDLAVHASQQRYEHVRTTATGAVVRFSSGSFTADLTVDADGFVVDYPDLAHRVLG